MKRKFKFDAKMAKKYLSGILIALIVGLFLMIIIQSYNPNHTLSKSEAPEIMIPKGSYEDFLKIKQNIPADSLDKYPLDFSKVKVPQMENDIIVQGIDGIVHEGAVDFVVSDLNEFTDSEGNDVRALETTDEGFVTWEINGIQESGFYNIYVNYFPISDGGASIERRIYINQDIDTTDENKVYTTQYSNLENVKFPRFWTNRDEIIQDTTGNDMKPRQKEILGIQRKMYLRDESGYIVEPYLIYLEGGQTNTITFESIREAMAIVSIGVTSYKSQVSYETYREILSNKGYTDVNQLDEPIRIEGEDASERTSPTLYAIADRTDPTNYPVDPVKIKLNSIGGTKWVNPGDAITWNVDLTGKESGLYYISFRSKQDVSRGLFSTRKVYINGEIPFLEANSTKFSYSSDFQIVTLGSETEPFAFYLEGGKVNTITLEATLGDYATPISQVKEAIDKLNNLYLRIIAVTTTSPDPYQNYYLYGENAKVVGTLETFEEAAIALENVSQKITEISGEKSDKVAILDKMAIQIRGMLNKPRTIQERLVDFGKNLSSLGTWITDIREQALSVEALWVHSSMDQLPKANANFFSGTWFGIRGFVQSFFFDYEAIGTIQSIEGAKDIEVWFLTSLVAGREQANSISTLISNSYNDFLKKEAVEKGEEYTPVNVNLKVVSPAVLLPSTLAGTGPDVAINVENGTPVNYALRNAIMDVSTFDEFYEVTGICSAANSKAGVCDSNDDNERRFENRENEQYLFYESAMVPYHFNGGYYALPNTQSFLVMFYRTDVFEDRGWTVPETWREVTSLVTELSVSNLQFYLPLALTGATSVVNSVFASMLYQRGGSFYRNDGRESNFDSEAAMLAFEEWTKYYTDYSFPLSANFLNRFRSGETPIGIAGYELFNTLTVFAPDIAGKWTFAPLPGTVNDEGDLINNGAASGTAVVMLKQSRDPEAAWDFMRWWVSKDVQREYAQELESILGAAARHNTANVLAFDQLPWTKEEKEVLISQWKNSVGVPEVPGGYYTGRNLENAFRQVVNNDSHPRETLQEYIILINNEITKKRAEFGLDEE